MQRCTTRREQLKLMDLARDSLWKFLNTQQMQNAIEPILIHTVDEKYGSESESEDLEESQRPKRVRRL